MTTPFVYISHDDFARSYRLESRLQELLPQYSRYISFGRGDFGPATQQWKPFEYGLVIFILSGPPDYDRWDPQGYRIQSELQTIDHELQYRSEKIPNTLMLTEKGVIDWVGRRGAAPRGEIKVISNIIGSRHWIEYIDDDELLRFLKNEITYFQERIHEVSERTDRSWRITLERAVQSKIGARWLPSGDHLRIDTSGTETDQNVAHDHLTTQLHEEVARRAREFLPVAERLSNSLGWEGIAPAARRFLGAIDCETERLPQSLGLAYDAMLELASFVEQDSELQRAPNSVAFSLDPEVRRPLRLLIRAGAPWLRRFPSVRELDDECGAFLSRSDLLQPATSVLEIARVKRLVADADANGIQGVLDAGRRGKFQSEKAGTRGTHTVRNLVIASSAAIGTFLSGAVASDYSTKSELIKHIGSTLAEAEQHITELVAEMPDDIRIALRELITEIKRRQIFL